MKPTAQVGTPDPNDNNHVGPDDVTTEYTAVDGQVVARGHSILATEAVELAAEFDDRSDETEYAERVAPEWLAEPDSIREVIAERVTRAWQVAMYHLARSPLYLLRLVATAPLGVVRTARDAYAWRNDGEYHAALEAMRLDGAKGDLEAMLVRHQATVKARTNTLLFLVLVAAVAGVVVWLAGLWLWAGLAAAVTVLVLGWRGRPLRSTPIVERSAYRVVSFPPFTEGLLLEALAAVGAAPSGKRAIRITQPPVRTRTGWEAQADLPVPASKVISERETFAGELGRPVPCVWLTTDPEQPPTVLTVTVTRRSLRHARMPEWPYLHGGSFDWFSDPVPIGINPLGGVIAARKTYRSTVYGGTMGSGKSVAMVTSIAAQAADPRVEVAIFDLKGGSDWLAFAAIAHVYVAGSDESDRAVALEYLRDVNARIDRRFKTLRRLAAEAKREGRPAAPKITTVLADDPALDLHPIVIVIDETQEMFEFAAEAAEFTALTSRAIKKGRAVGVIVEGGTQEVKKPTLPIAPLCHFRYCLAVQGHGQVDLVLNTGAYSAGHRANELTTDDVGIGYFGSGKDIGVVRGFYLDPESGELDAVMERFRADRQTRGRLTGMAAGDLDTDDTTEGTLDRVARVWAGTVDRLHLVELVDWLNRDRPDDYPPVTATTLESDDVRRATDTLGGQLRRYGIKPHSTRRPFLTDGAASVVRQGVTWDQIQNAITTRDNATPAATPVEPGPVPASRLRVIGEADTGDDEGDAGGSWDDTTEDDSDDTAGLLEGDTDPDDRRDIGEAGR